MSLAKPRIRSLVWTNLAASLFALPLARADAIPALTHAIEEQTAWFRQMSTPLPMAVGPRAGLESRDVPEAWFGRRFWFRFRPRASFELPGTIKLDVTPEIELLWDRPLPAGWQNYAPSLKPAAGP